MAPKPSQLDGDDASQLTQLLQRMHAGDKSAGEQAAALVYDELHKIASRQLSRERADHLLQTTALIHEAYARLMGSAPAEIQNRRHFFAIASQQMRHVLIDDARSRDAQRRGGGLGHVDINEVQVGMDPRGIDLLLLDESLEQLQRVDQRSARVVEMRFFGGYNEHEIAEALEVSFAMVRRDWAFARAFLFDRMNGEPRR